MASRTEILYPRGESVVCSGTTELLARGRGPAARRSLARDPRVRWSYAAGDGPFRAVRGSARRLGFGAPLMAKSWETTGVPSGPVRLRARMRGASATHSRFRLDDPPRLGPISAVQDPETGVVTLAAPEAGDREDAGPPKLTWYLGDGTTEAGATASHRYDENGHYVVEVQGEDEDGCDSLRVVDLSVPVGGPKDDLSEVDWCDPLEAKIRPDGESYGFWPPDIGTNPESKDAPAKIALGPRQGKKDFAAAYGFEIRMLVFGNPEKCTSRQVVRSRHIVERKNGIQLAKQPIRATYADDGYGSDGRFRKAVPRADGKAEVTWLDFPGVIADASYTNAQVNADFISYVSGQEAPIEHEEPEGIGSEKGETAYLRFSVCAAWKPPEGKRGFDFKLHEKKGPDDVVPKAARKEKLAAEDDKATIDTDRGVTGCGAK
jgi:hypothetical protein